IPSPTEMTVPTSLSLLIVSKFSIPSRRIEIISSELIELTYVHLQACLSSAQRFRKPVQTALHAPVILIISDAEDESAQHGRIMTDLDQRLIRAVSAAQERFHSLPLLLSRGVRACEHRP